MERGQGALTQANDFSINHAIHAVLPILIGAEEIGDCF